MRLTPGQLSWRVLFKCAADDFLRGRVKAVAKMRKFPLPSDQDVDKIFPPGWEDTFRRQGKEPSWQVQLENSDWLKRHNSAQIGGSTTPPPPPSGGRRYSGPFDDEWNRRKWDPTPSESSRNRSWWGDMSPEDKLSMGILAAGLVGGAAYAYYRYRKQKAKEEAESKARQRGARR